MSTLIELNDDQSAALAAIKTWFSDPNSRTLRVGGYAGTGKTTLISAVMRELVDVHIVVCAFTGKAVSVLKSKGITDALTMHRLIYIPVTACSACGLEPIDGGASRPTICPRCQSTKLKVTFIKTHIIQADLVIVDESSMLTARLVADVESLAPKVLYFGDHGQLEPIGDDPGIMRNPDIRLERIHRQAEGSGTLRLAHLLRENHHPATWEPTADAEVRKGDLRGIRMSQYDVVLCGYNYTRVAVNRRIRAERGFAGVPQLGERLICLQNDKNIGIYNGQLVCVTKRDKGATSDLIVLDFVDELGERWAKVPVLLSQFNSDTRPEGRNPGIGVFDYGYAMTVHKCVSGDTLVQTAHGWQRIDSVVAKRGHVATMDGSLHKYSAFIERPEAEMLTLKCEGGYQIRVTPDHRMRVYNKEHDDWRAQEAGKVQPGTWLRLRLGQITGLNPEPASLPPVPPGDVRARLISTPAHIGVELAEFFGLMVGDGTRFRAGIRLAKRHNDVVERFAFLGERIFGLTPHLFSIDGTPAAEFHSTILSDWLRQIGGMEPRDKHIPASVYSGTMDIRSAFLRGLFEDGAVSVKGDYVDHIAFMNISHDIVRTVQTFLLEFGIISTIRTDQRLAKLYIYGDSISLFRDAIGFVAKMKNDRLRGRCGRTTRRRIPIDYKKLRGSARNNARARGYISRDVAGSLGFSDKLAFHYVRVESIEVGRAKSYCLTVPSTGSFLQNRFDGLNSQGSEWPKVAVLEQISSSWTAARWRYTAVTRASESVHYYLSKKKSRTQ